MPTTGVGLDCRGVGASFADFWMECDDLKNCVCKYSDLRPVIPASQVHIVMWEKQSKNSGYRLPCEKESFNKVQKSFVDHVLSNQFPSPLMTSIFAVSGSTCNVPVTSLPATTVLRPSSYVGQHGTAVSAVAHIKDQDENCSKSCKKMTDTRLQRMKQKYELDRKRSSCLNSSKPVIPRIPIGISTASEQPNKKNVHFLPGKMDFPGGRYSPSKIIGCISPQKLSRLSVQSVVHENNTAKSNVRADRHNLAAVQTRSLLKVGRQSYIESILPLITERKQSTTVVQKFEAYIPKSQKVTSASVNETVKTSLTDRGNTALDMKTRKPRVCFSEGNLQNDKQHQLPENITNGLSVNQMPAKSGILAKPYVLPKYTLQSERKFCFDDAELDFSNFLDLDKILFEDNNSLVAETAFNSTSVACPSLQHNGGNASNCISAATESSASSLTSTIANGFDVPSVMRDNTSGFESTVFRDAVYSSLPNFGDFVPSDNWTSSLSGSSHKNIISNCVNASVMNSSLSNSTIGNYLNGNIGDVYGYTIIDDDAVSSITSVLPSTNYLAEDLTNLPLPVESFNFGEEVWSWFS